jgi:glucose/arabinose dehydrogenase
MVVTEWTASDPTAAVFAGTYREVLRVAQPSWGHAIGMLAFNPNAAPGSPDHGKLYISMGDAGDNQSYLLNGQALSNPYGKVLRIDPTAGGGAGFTVPADNPFVGQPGAEATIWAHGLRNPQYLSWLRDSLPGGGAGTMFIADIGEGDIEDVNTGVAGGNYGWSIREGTFATWRDPALGIGDVMGVFELAGGPEAGLRYPVAQYDHDEGRAIGSALIYQGAAVPGLAGRLVATDIVNGRLFVADVDGLVSDDDPDGVAGFAELTTIVNGIEQPLLAALGTPRADARLGTDDAGNLYVVTKAGGQIFRVEAQAVPGPGGLGVFVVGVLGLALIRKKGRIFFF